MNIGVVHHSLDGKGGSGRLAINTIELLKDMGFYVILIICQRPNLEKLKTTYNKDIHVDRIKALFPAQIRAFGIYQRMLTLIPAALTNVDLLISTHGDLLPYHITNRCPLISYCHYPTIALSMDGGASRYTNSLLWRSYFAPYERMTRYLSKPAHVRGRVLTNSKFSKNAITRLYPDIEPTIVYPSADTKSFKKALMSDRREDKILVLCRFTPEKSIENALILAKKLHTKTTIIGSLIPSNRYYFDHLVQMSRSLGIEDLIEFKPNASFNAIIEEMFKSKVYLHTMRGEHFGISIVEAMSAGLIPVVPDYGGCAEIVPEEYQYDGIDTAYATIQSALDASFSDRKRVSDIADLFSDDTFKMSMKKIVEQELGVRPSERLRHTATEA